MSEGFRTMKLLKKITVKTCHGKTMSADWLFPQDAKEGLERCVLTVVGRADKMEHGKSTLPSGDETEYVKFRGEFVAWPGEMGEAGITQYRSSVLILPEVASGPLEVTMSDEKITAANFGFRITVIKQKTTVGFSYQAEPLTEQDEADPLAALIKLASSRVPQLAKPQAVAGGKK